MGDARVVHAMRQRPWLTAWLTLMPFVLLRAGTLAEADTFWQIRTGLLTMANRAIPTTDPFSWTAHGDPWTLNSWAFNVLLAVAYRVAGLPAVALVGAALVAVVLWLVLAVGSKDRGEPDRGRRVLLQFAFALLMVYFSARPQLVDYVAAALVGVAARKARERGRPRRCGVVAAIGVVMTAWVNLHAACTSWCRNHRRRRPPWWALNPRYPKRALAACLAALLVAAGCSLANPYGADVFTQAGASRRCPPRS